MDAFLHASLSSPQSPRSPEPSYPPLTFTLKLGLVSFLQNETLYKARIADSMEISDEFHQRRFGDVTDWINYIQSKYPSPTSSKPVSKTMHEHFKSINVSQNHSNHTNNDIYKDESIDHFSVNNLMESILHPMVFNGTWKDSSFRMEERKVGRRRSNGSDDEYEMFGHWKNERLKIEVLIKFIAMLLLEIQMIEEVGQLEVGPVERVVGL